MRSLSILVCTIGLSLTGCQTATKQATCCRTCSNSTACNSCTATNIGVAAVKSAQPVKVAQTAPPEEEAVVKQVTSTVEETVNPFETDLANAKPQAEPEPAELPIPEYGHGKNYRWLLGHLQRVHSPKHQWKIRYAALDENDEWGGSMILAPDAQLDQWKDGDQVYVEGEILTKRPSLYLTGPLYRVHIIRSAEQATQIIPQLTR